MAEHRPSTFGEFIGQSLAVRQIRLALDSAKLREDVIDHVLLAGPPGVGKTTIAQLIAGELGTRCIETNAVVLKTPADMTSSLVNLKRGDVLFVDEIHEMPIHVQEFLYTAMEDYKISMVSHVAAQRRAITIQLKKFVLVGATTIEGQLTGPMLDRFGIVCRLKVYTNDDIKQIIKRQAARIKIEITEKALDLMAERARATPRVALRHLRRILDSAVSLGSPSKVNEHHALHAYSVLGIGKLGLTEQDLAVLRTLANSAYLVGLVQLAMHVNTSALTVETVIEPHLLRIGAIERTPRGRRITEFGRSLIK